MLQVGSQSISDISLSRYRRGAVPIGASPLTTGQSTTSRSPQFGNALAGLSRHVSTSATSTLLPIFQKITEVFLVAFLAQDVVAMWLPRVGTSLVTGRVPYDPSTDPKAQKLPFAEQMKLWLRKNLEGLNWVNLNEESKREFATGPGVLMLPAVVYMAARRLFGKEAIEMSYPALNGLSQGFKQHLLKTELATRLNPSVADYRNEMARYIASIFHDPDMKAKALVDLPKSGTKTPAWIQKHLASFNARTHQNYGEYIQTWADEWCRASLEMTDGKKRKALLQHLTEDFQSRIVGFNRQHRLNAEAAKLLKTEHLIHKTDHALVSFRRGAAAELKPISGLLYDLRKWGDFARAVIEEKAKPANAKILLPEMVQGVLNKLVTRKSLLGIATLLGAGYYLIRLAQWAQSHDSYQATRLLKTPANNAAHQASPAEATGRHA